MKAIKHPYLFQSNSFQREQRLLEEKNNLKKEKDDIKKLYNRLSKDYTKTKIDYEELTKKCLEKDNEVEELKKKNGHKEERIECLQNDNQFKQANIDSLEERVKKLEETVEKLRKEIERLREDVSELEDRLIAQGDKNDNNSQTQPPPIAGEFLRLVSEFFARELRLSDAQLRRVQYSNTLRIDDIKECVISILGDDQKSKELLTKKINELPPEIFKKWFSDFLVSEKCPKLFSTNYEAAKTEIKDSCTENGLKEDALKVIEYLRVMYDKLGEPFGGTKPNSHQGATGPSLPKRPRRKSQTGGNQ